MDRLKKQSLIIASVIISLSTLAIADFTDDFQDALKLYNNSKNTEAVGKFIKLAGLAPNEGTKSDALYYAVMSAIKARQFKQAEELLDQVPRESTKKLCRMNLMLAQGQAQALVTRFKDEDLTEWSDFHIYDALMARGKAYETLKQYSEAIKDFRKAEEFALTPAKKVLVLLRIGALLQLSGDDDQALTVYRQIEDIPSMRGYGISNDAIIYAARILAKQQKYDEALKELAGIRPEKSGYWHDYPLMVQAEVHVAQGKKTEAVAKYKEALQDAPEDLKKSIQTAIDKLK